ncbi:MAG: hypothetical protein QXK37_06040 [Candidatus Woesearchaeota archaeon]
MAKEKRMLKTFIITALATALFILQALAQTIENSTTEDYVSFKPPIKTDPKPTEPSTSTTENQRTHTAQLSGRYSSTRVNIDTGIVEEIRLSSGMVLKRNEKGWYCNDQFCVTSEGTIRGPNGAALPKDAKIPDDLRIFADDLDDNLEDIQELAAVDYKNLHNDQNMPWLREKLQTYYDSINAATRSKLNQILSAYLDELLGPFSQGIPAEMCGDSLYIKETDWKSKVAGIPIPTSTYESEMVKQINENIRTVIIEGEKSELTNNLYRYAVTLKIIGDKNVEWELYFYNSCTKEDSKEFWHEKGMISKRQFFGMHYADNTVFDCELKKPCRFNQACLKFKDEAKAHCVTLAHGSGFRTGDRSC